MTHDVAHEPAEHTVPTLAEATIGGLKEAVGYDEETDGGVDVLIAYKNAVEDRLCEALAEIQRLRMNPDEIEVLGGLLHWDEEAREWVLAKDQVWESLRLRFPSPPKNAFDSLV